MALVRRGRLSKADHNRLDLAGQARTQATAAIETLIRFANFPRPGQPWADFWGVARRYHRARPGQRVRVEQRPGYTDWLVRGEPFNDVSADELQRQVRGDLRRIVAGTYQLGALVPLRTRWAYLKHRVLTFPPQDDLFEYLLWARLHACQEGTKIRACPYCHLFFQRTGKGPEPKTCGATTCRRLWNNARQKTYRPS